ncbi:DUF2147 domain-containing protein [Sandarakinorhabdus sp.]|uniref:DUF2147 domain-containing protein n=1 Tax=Sandarakinorhabdus sp. TaxID=1916663 RepID=UPI00286EA0DC|nr:DUF2147 domain-containing protein [Sandarakinorhabdus sp.]
MIAAVRMLALLALTAGVANAAPPPKYRTYRNPSNSVHIQPRPCGANICGVVVWANDKAKADAAKGGTPNLVGQQLFREFTPVGPDKWKGSVFVPDINKTFSGQVVRTGPNTLKGTGCLFGKMGCKSQEWTLVK